MTERRNTTDRKSSFLADKIRIRSPGLAGQTKAISQHLQVALPVTCDKRHDGPVA